LGERGQRFAQADANSDGEITKDELQAAFARMREQAARAFNPEQVFARLDENSDGKLTKEELGERGQWALRADANSDGEISKDEFKAGAGRLQDAARAFNPEQLFARMDQNGDGKLQKDEVRGPLAERTAEVDGDKDGEISKEEFQAAAQRIRGLFGGGPGGPPRIPSAEETFAQFDKNSDGKLTKEELPERAAEFILRADSDSDGAVTKEELQAARERLGQNRGDRRPGERQRPPAEENKPEQNKK
jgi:Ca2+-binding EF-hand superfamily protein